jgi:hypothetical protein
VSKKTAKGPEVSSKGKLSTTNQASGTKHLADLDINTEFGQEEATNGIWKALSLGTADPELTKLQLSTLGKVLNRENMKIRAGFYKLTGAKSKFFLTA